MLHEVMQKQGGTSKESKLVGAYVPAELHAQVVDLARREDRSMASLIRRALERELERAAA